MKNLTAWEIDVLLRAQAEAADALATIAIPHRFLENEARARAQIAALMSAIDRPLAQAKQALQTIVSAAELQARLDGGTIPIVLAARAAAAPPEPLPAPVRPRRQRRSPPRVVARLRAALAEREARIAELERRIHSIQLAEYLGAGDWYDPDFFLFSEN